MQITDKAKFKKGDFITTYIIPHTPWYKRLYMWVMRKDLSPEANHFVVTAVSDHEIDVRPVYK